VLREGNRGLRFRVLGLGFRVGGVVSTGTEARIKCFLS
jgi:hypothetical protein